MPQKRFFEPLVSGVIRRADRESGLFGRAFFAMSATWKTCGPGASVGMSKEPPGATWASEQEPCARASAVRVERIAEAVADQVHGEHRDEDREAGRDPVPGIVAQDEQLLRVVEHVAPGGLRRPNPDAEVGQGRLGEERDRNSERAGHGQWREGVK